MAQSQSQLIQELSADEVVLRHHFPAEVWHMIFTKCNSESLVALCGTSACFKTWLLSGRTVYLFPQVWSIVRNTYIKIHEQEIQTDFKKVAISYFQQVLALLQDRLETKAQPRLPTGIIAFLTRSNNTTLAFRLVCKAWRDAIDSVNLIELDNIKTNPRKFFGSQDIRKWTAKQETELCSTFDFGKFEKIVVGRNCDKVSNFVRAIVITGWSSEVFSLLKLIGNDVWYCTIKTHVERSLSNENAFKNIRKTLSLLPNLKTLEIDNENAPSGRYLDPVVDNQLLKIVGENPLKRLEKLEILVTKDLPFPIFNEMVRSNNQIKFLHVVRNLSYEEYDICTLPLPNLEELSFNIFTNYDLEALCQACVTTWKMAKLYLIVDRVYALNWYKLTELCEKILKNNYVTLVVYGKKLEGLGTEVAKNLQELRPRWF